MSKNLKFSTAVLVALNEVSKKPSFSAYDVTRYLRDAVNNNQITISDKQTENIGGLSTVRIEHNEVKAQFQDILDSGLVDLQGKFNGVYNEYNKKTTYIAAPVNQSNPKANHVVVPKNVTTIPTFAAQVDKYFRGFAKGCKITMKQVQSRFDSRTGVSCADYAKELARLGYLVNQSGQFASYWTVTI